MTHIDLQADKAQIIQELLMIDDENAIKSIKRYISSHRVKKQSPAAITIDELNTVLLKQEQDLNPIYIKHDEVIKKLSAWR